MTRSELLSLKLNEFTLITSVKTNLYSCEEYKTCYIIDLVDIMIYDHASSGNQSGTDVFLLRTGIKISDQTALKKQFGLKQAR